MSDRRTPGVLPLIVVVGPTASGKTRSAIGLATRLGGEVVNADSMALYRGMDIGTAKPSVAERGDVPHHLLDIWQVRDAASVADYQRRAVECIGQIRSRGRVPILVGGSGLYVRAAVDDLTFPGTDEAVRSRLYAELEQRGPSALHERLRALDPAGAARVQPENGRRIVRALEIVELTGAPQGSSLPRYDAPAPHAVDAIHLGLDVPGDELDARVHRRAEGMFSAGLVEEVRGLIGEGFRDGVTARRALGYQQALDVIDGELTVAEAVLATAAATRRFIRRQRSWFRRDPRISWLGAPELDPLTRTVEDRIAKGCR